MAELDFGDGELFEQLEGLSPPRPQVCAADGGQALEELRQLRERLGEYEETIDSLIAENILACCGGESPAGVHGLSRRKGNQILLFEQELARYTVFSLFLF